MKRKNGWEENRKWVQNELKEHGKTLEKITDLLGTIREDIAGLKVKAGFWGFIGGALAILISILVGLLNGGK